MTRKDGTSPRYGESVRRDRDASIEKIPADRAAEGRHFPCVLGSDVSSEIFKHLREDEIEQLTFEIARLDRIEPEDKDKVLMEFQEMMMAQDFIASGGIDYAREVLERALGTQKAIDIVNRLTSSLQVRPFDFIRRTDPSHLLNFIQGEHPQTIALILAYLDAAGAQILSGLSHQIQADVAKRIATMDRTSPDVLREVERGARAEALHAGLGGLHVAGGIDAIVEVLNQVDRGTEKIIIEALEEEDPSSPRK